MGKTIQLSDLRNHRKECEVTWEGQTCTVGYRPYDAGTEEKLRAAVNPEDPNRAAAQIAELLAEMLVDVDVLDAEGQRVPPSVENLKAFPTLFLVAVATAVMEDMRPPAPPAGTSGATSEPRAT